MRRCILCQFLVSGLQEVKMVMRFRVESGIGDRYLYTVCISVQTNMVVSRTAFLTLFPAQFYRNKWHLVQARGLGAIGLQSQSKVSPYILGEVIAV